MIRTVSIQAVLLLHGSLLVNGMSLFIGLDLGTSGARISVVDASLKEVFSSSVAWQRYDDPKLWMKSVTDLFQEASSSVESLSSQSTAVCVSGTSASCLVVDGKTLQVQRKPCMYDHHVIQSSSDNPTDGLRALEWLQAHAPPQHTAQSPTGTLAKLLAWHSQSALAPSARLLHQADYVALKLSHDKACGQAARPVAAASDWHNCLKLGYDVALQQWPPWMDRLLESIRLPPEVLPSRVVSPGVPWGSISPATARRLGLSPGTVLVGGTTDSNAAWVAAAGLSPTLGTAATSLGSTLALKRVCSAPVENADLGVYSHAVPRTLLPRTDDQATTTPPRLWLVGGASNVGCAVLRSEGFSNDELQELSKRIDPQTDSPFDYYPLVKPGERFPVANAFKAPVLEPKPQGQNARTEYLKALLQGVAKVEAQGYATLDQLGATPPLTAVLTSGGGSQNEQWTSMRQRWLSRSQARDVVVTRAAHSEASYGAALLAASSFANAASRSP